jgi:signal transduction histidine kinase/streptogramin lyase
MLPPAPRFALLRTVLAATALLLGFAVAAAAAAPPAALPETPQFRRFGVEQGLPSSRINGLAQDRAGYLWVATDDGVARYDGVGMRVWRHNPGIVGGMPDNLVNTLLIDGRDEVWLAFSSGGIGVIDARRREVRPLTDADSGDLARADVWAMAETPDGSLWFGAFGQGLFRRAADGRVEHIGAVPVGRGAEPRVDIVSLAVGSDGTLWIGTGGGLARRADGQLEPVAFDGIDGQAVMHLSPEPDGRLWVSTRSALFVRDGDGRIEASPWPEALAGLRVHGVQRDGRGGRWVHTSRGLFYDGGRGLRRFLSPEAAEGGYQHMLVDRQGGLWFGDAEFGLVWLSAHWRSFASLTREGEPQLRLSMRQAVAFNEDADGSVWIGGDDGHLDRLDPARGVVERGVVDPAVFDRGRIFSLARHADGALWVGTASLLLRRDASGRWQRWSRSGDDALPPGSIDAIVPMDDGTVWIAAYGGGLQRRGADGRLQLAVTPESGHGLETPDVEALLRGPDGGLWAGNSQGLLRWNGERFETQLDAEGGPVQGVAFANGNDVWLYRPGLLERWQRDVEGRWARSARADSANDGLPPAEAGGLVRDAAGRLWIFTVRGLVRFDPNAPGLRRFGLGDGLGMTEFGLRPPRVLRSGAVIAGAVGGAVLFDPMAVEPDARVASMVLESISVRRAEDEIELDPSGPIVLQPDDRDLRVAARLMSLSDPASHRYRFRLNGYDPDWVDVGARGERQLPRQAPGSYTLDIVAAGADGRWSETQRIAFRVQPPWWRSWWALAAYAVATLALLALGAWLLRRRYAARIERERAKEARLMAQQASDAKSAFLADLGHELRTPLTGVLGMTELLLKEPLTPSQRHRAESALRSGQHLLRLVNDTLDLARIEAGRLLLQDEAFDLSGVVADVAQMLRPAAEAKGLALVVRLEPGLPPRVRGDEARLRQILLNLGGNAVKFTERGSVTLAAAPLADGALEFVVQDTGIGLDAAQQQRLFQRFEQAEGEHTQRRYGGTGLGLAISRQLAQAMGGELTLRSARGEGSRFSVRLPLRAADDAGRPAAPAASGADAAAATRVLDVLLVEDDPVVAEVMTGLLESLGHRVHHASQALIALTLLKTQRIDIGLLDLDLPAVDGLELATMIRTNGWTLPLIAVTARADAASERAARAAGMDGYLRKPVSGAMLAETLAGVTPSPA